MKQNDLESCFVKESLMEVGMRNAKETKESWRTVYGSLGEACIRSKARAFSPRSPPGLSGLHCSEATRASRHVSRICSFITKQQLLLLFLLLLLLLLFLLFFLILFFLPLLSRLLVYFLLHLSSLGDHQTPPFFSLTTSFFDYPLCCYHHPSLPFFLLLCFCSR